MPTFAVNHLLRTAARGAAVMAAATLGTVAVAQSSSIDVSGRAAPGSVTRSRAIEIGDLNLASAQGQRRLDQRLRHTARYVCNDSAMYGVRAPKDYTRCYSEALTGAHSMVAKQVAAGDMSPVRVSMR